MPSEQLEQLRAMLAAAPIRADAPVEEQRAGMAMIGSLIPLAEGATVRPVDAGGVPAELVRPAEQTAPAGAVVVHLHSGGYCIGGPDSHRPFATRLANAVGAPVLVPDYRLAPEHPHPAALEDARRAFEWVLGHHRPELVVVSGDSAGGGLAVALACALRDAGAPLPAAIACLSPWTDLTGTAPSMTANAATDVVLIPATVEVWAASYVGDRSRTDPAISPLHADLSGLPPMLVQATDTELLVDDATRLAERAEAAGVDVTLEVRPGLVHDWHLFAGMIPEGDEDVARVAAFLRSHLERSGPVGG